MPFSTRLLFKSARNIHRILQDGDTSQSSCHAEKVNTTVQDRIYYNREGSEQGIHLDDNGSTIYAIGSLTKLLISLLLMIIIDKLSASKEDKHKRYRKLGEEFSDPWNVEFTILFNRFSKTEIADIPGNPKLWHILTHFNSLPPMTHVLLGPDGTSLMSKESFLKVAPRLAQLAYGNAQGNRTIYSNGNFVLIGLFIEAIAEQPLECVIKEHLFDLLGMNRSFLGPPDSKITGIASPYTMTVDGRRVQAETKPYPVRDIMNAAAGAWSCCNDLAIVFRDLLNCIRNRESVFKKATVTGFLLTPSPLDNTTEDGFTIFGFLTTLDSSIIGSLSLNRHVSMDDICSTYQLGRRPDGRQVPTYYLAGHIEGYSSCYYLIPQYSTFVITLTNTSGLHDASDHISRFLLQKIFDLKRPRTGLARIWRAGFSKKVNVLEMSSRAAVQGQNLLKDFATEYGEKDMDGADSIQLAGTYVSEVTELSIVIRPDSLLVNIVGTAQTTDNKFVRTGDMGLIRTGYDTIRLRPLSDVGFTIDRYDSYNWKELTFHLVRDKATKQKVIGLERRIKPLADKFTRRES
ncbi:hypothetical protein OIDMADRAFT_61364 [Oidiodendron maius Zn]|uniref:Beta-lactamase-related domain-containing protein n=1 Tax=Oidiodendron maius (strain Zn) TaxID=913774 RepID=A0A0C3CVK2_OIDMZ|nr:hypothetical protein OIDMADRAFT_61364 [Oidiodendron maius Zn]